MHAERLDDICPEPLEPRPYVAKGQKQAKGGSQFLAPPTEKRIRQRDRFFRMVGYLPAKGLIRYLSTRTATGIDLPSY